MKYRPFSIHWSVCDQQSEKKIIKFNESDQCHCFFTRRGEDGSGGRCDRKWKIENKIIISYLIVYFQLFHTTTV